jgi:DNA-binding MarR family transcriptional regulator
MNTIQESIIAVTRSPHDFSFRQIAVLLVCADTPDEHDRQTRTVAERLDFSRPVVSRATDRLEEAGLIRRQGLAGDERACVLEVTGKGHDFIRIVIHGEPARKSARRRAA